MTDTLALIELINVDDVLAELGDGCAELFLEEFVNRIRQLARPQDEVLEVQPHKYCVRFMGVWDPQQVELAGAKLTRVFEQPIELLGEEVRPDVRASFVPPGARSVDMKERVRIAEAALREARRTNKPYVIREEFEQRGSDETLRREREVERALDQGEFVMYYQQQVSAAYRNVVGAEALMRWHSPSGVRQPLEFIPFAKKIDLQKQLTWFAIKSAVGSASTWPNELSVAVNVPPTLLRDSDLVPVVSDTLAIFGFDPARLTLEITEDAMIDDPEAAMLVLQELRDAGVRVAIDDFGTGYSSLSYFRDLPVDELKVDRSFVSRMLEQPKDADIVRAIVDLAHNFSLKVVAEGVETAAMADALQALGCDILQGYFLGPPVPAAELLAALD